MTSSIAPSTAPSRTPTVAVSVTPTIAPSVARAGEHYFQFDSTLVR
jgi:hypothetical protein